jgi:hypothetical protein
MRVATLRNDSHDDYIYLCIALAKGLNFVAVLVIDGLPGAFFAMFRKQHNNSRICAPQTTMFVLLRKLGTQ